MSVTSLHLPSSLTKTTNPPLETQPEDRESDRERKRAMEFLAEIPKQMIGKIGDCLALNVEAHFGYLIHAKRNARNLKEQAENLQFERETLQRHIDAAKRNLEEIEPAVQKWVERVDAVTPHVYAQQFLEADWAKHKHRCFNGWCINLWSRYKTGKEAKQKATEITEYQIPKFEKVAYHVPQHEAGLAFSIKMFSAFKSRKSTVKDIMEAMENDNINIIGVCGMGGVGKTTIVEEVRRQVQQNKLFNVTAMVVVSQTPNLTKIQDEIAVILDLCLNPRHESERAPMLWKRIKQEKKMLIILDDVWSWLELKEIGIPLGEDHPGCKIVLTSRYKDVCDEMNAQKTFSIEVLPEEEAWELFRGMVGEVVESSDLNSMAREISRVCRGLPIAIVTIGRALRNRPKEIWIDAATQLKKPVPAANIKGIELFLYSRLKLSYDYLESEETKSYFLLCSLFPEDELIPLDRLLEYGMGLRLLKDVDSIEDARVRAHALVRTLVSSFLLMEEKKRLEYVKMHDVVRDVAILIASKENQYLIKAGCGLTKWPHKDATLQKFRGISLMRNDICKLLEGLDCPELWILLLNDQKTHELEIPTKFFQGIKNLKVLDVSGNTIVPSLLQSVGMLTTLQTLVLHKCKFGGEISIIGTLKQLEILNLNGSDVKEVPEHFSQLTRLRYFDLTNCPFLTKIFPGVISSLRELELLSIGYQFSNWAGAADDEEEENSSSNASITELNSLSQLTSLSFYVPNVDMLACDLKILQNLTRFEIRIGCNFPYSVNSYGKNVALRWDNASLMSDPVKALVKATEFLTLINCTGLKNIIGDLGKDGFDELKHLEIEGCGEMKYLVEMVNGAPREAFCNLKYLKLHRLNLSEIWHGQFSILAESYSKLGRLEVFHCDSMSSIVPSNLLIWSQCLDYLHVSWCHNLLNVFDLEGLDTNLVSSLQTLDIDHLCELLHIWKGPCQFLDLCNLISVRVLFCEKLRQLFPPRLVRGLVRLETLFIRCCSNLEEIFGTHHEEEKEEEQQQQTEIVNVAVGKSLSTRTSLQNLTQVKVGGCNRLRNIFSTSMAEGLVQLRTLTIESCPMMEAVIEDGKELEDTGSAIEKIVFPHLHQILLHKLDSLTCFCTSRYSIEYSSLDGISIVSCPKMETFGRGAQITPKLKQVRLGREIWMGGLNAIIQHNFKQK